MFNQVVNRLQCKLDINVQHDDECYQQEEDDVGDMEGQDDAVEVDELRCCKECCPLSPGLIVLSPLLTPWSSKEALCNAHVGQGYVTWTKLFNDCNNDAKNQWHTLINTAIELF